ncbi:MAG: hypothetical protein WBG23_13310 [Acidobacteriaceae bacterium]|jgi:hypothetical protein
MIWSGLSVRTKIVLGNLFKRLGMTSSSYVWRTEFDTLTATGHDADGNPAELWKPIEAGAAS